MSRVVIDSIELKNAVKFAKKMVGKKYQGCLSGIHLKTGEFENVLIISTIDGFRGFNCSIPLIDKSGSFDITVPVFDVPKDAGEVTSIKVDDENVWIDFDNLEIKVKTLEGRFPDISDMFEPNEIEYEIGIDSKYLKDALDACASSNKHVKMQFKGKTKPIIVSNPDNSSTKCVVLPVRLGKRG